mgnify:CR=1 FL=1
MSVRKDKVQLEIEINGEKVIASYKQMQKVARDLNRELNNLTPGTEDFIKKSAELKDVNNRLATIRETTKGVSAQLDKGSGFLSKFGLSLSSISFFGIIGGAIAATKSTFDLAKANETYLATLRTATGSQKQAEESLQLVKDVAQGTVFTLDELTQAYIKMRNRGLNPTKEEILSLADLAASQGKSFNDLVEAILDAQTGEFERLKEFGIRGSKAGDTAKLSFKGFNETVALTPEAMTQAIVAMGQMNGIAGSNADRMATAEGRISNFKDAAAQLATVIGQGFSGTISRIFGSLTGLANSIKEYISPTKTAQEVTRDLQKEFNFEIETLKRLAPESENRKALIAQINDKYGEYLPNLLSEKSSLQEIEKAQKSANKAFEEKLLYLAFEEEIQKNAEKTKKAIKELAGAELARAKNAASQQDLIAKGYSPQQIEQINKTNASFTGAVEENAKAIVDSNKNAIDDLEQSFGKAAEKLGTSLDKIKSKFGAVKDEISGTGTGIGSGDDKDTKYKKPRKEEKAAALDADSIANQFKAFQQRLKLQQEEAKVFQDFFQKDLDARIAQIQAATDQELTEEQRKFVEKITTEEQYNIARAQLLLKGKEAELELLAGLGLEETDLYRKTLQDKLTAQQGYNDQVVSNEERTAQIIESINKNKYEYAKSALDVGIQLLSKDEAARKKNASAIKAFETANVLVNLASEISGIFKGYSTLPFIGKALAFVEAGFATGRAYANVRRIQAQKFARSGKVQNLPAGRIDVAPNIPTQSNGDNVLATVKTNEVILNENHQAALGGDRVFRAIGVPGFADGGRVATKPQNIPGLGGFADIMNAAQVMLEAATTLKNTRIKAKVVHTELQEVADEFDYIKKLSQA